MKDLPPVSPLNSLTICRHFSPPDPLEQIRWALHHNPQGPCSGRVTSVETKASLGDTTVRLVVGGTIFRAVDQKNASAPEPTAKPAETAPVLIVRAGKVEERVLHFDPFNISNAGRWDVHVASRVHPIPERRCAQP